MPKPPEACAENCRLYQTCVESNNKDVADIEKYEIARMLEKVQFDWIAGDDVIERIKDLEDRFWLIMYGTETSDLEERRALLEAEERDIIDRMEFLSEGIHDFLSGKTLQEDRDNFVAEQRLNMRKRFTDQVEAEGCDGPTTKRRILGLLGKRVFVACNAPVTPLTKRLAEKPFTIEDIQRGDIE